MQNVFNEKQQFWERFWVNWKKKQMFAFLHFLIISYAW